MARKKTPAPSDAPDNQAGEAAPKILYCSFCGKSQHQLEKLIAGPSVFICNECVGLCSEIIADTAGEPQGSTLPNRVTVILCEVRAMQKSLADLAEQLESVRALAMLSTTPPDPL